MYASPDEARSDLFLAGAVFVFGGTLVTILLSVIPLGRIPGVAPGLALVMPIVLTVLVPTLLIRYRKQSWADHGLAGFDASVAPALLAAAVITVGGVAATLLMGRPATSAMPVLQMANAPLGVVSSTLQVTGSLVLAGYGMVKARDAFRGNPVGLGEAVLRIGRIVAIVGGFALALMIMGDLFSGRNDLDGLVLVGYLLRPAAVAAAVWLVLRQLGGDGTSTLPVLITPTAIMALGQFGLRFGGGAFLDSLYRAALFAGVGIVLAVIAERTGRISGAVILGLGVALLAGLS